MIKPSLDLHEIEDDPENFEDYIFDFGKELINLTTFTGSLEELAKI